MVFINYKQTNLAEGQLFAGISASQTSLILKTGQGGLFPSTYPFKLKLEKFDTTSTLENKPVIKREIIKVTNRSGDTFTIERGVEECPASDTAVTQTTTQFAFDADDFVFLVQTAGDDKDVKDELVRLETDKAEDDEVVKLTGNQTVGGIKTFPISPIIPIPDEDMEGANKKYVDDSIEIGKEQSVLVNSDYIAGESIDKGDSLFIEDNIEETIATLSQNVGDVAGNTRVSIRQVGSGVSTNKLNLLLGKVDTLGADLLIRLETDSGGQPSGNLIDVNGTATILRSALTTSLVNTEISLTSGITNNAHGVTLDDTSTETIKRGLKFTATTEIGVVTVEKNSLCDATKAYLYDEDMNLLETATFSTDTATFNYGTNLGQTYFILVGSDGAPYTSVKQTGSSGFPYSMSKLDYVAGKYIPVDITDVFTRNYLSRTSVIPTEQSISFTVDTVSYLKSCYFENSGTNYRLYDGVTLIETSSNGIFSGETQLQTGITYTMNYSATGYYSGGTNTFPQVGSTITYTGISGGAGSGSITVLEVQTEDDNIYNIEDITTNDFLSVPKGKVYHIVVSQVGDDVDPARYFKIGYANKHTTTRGMGLYDGSSYGGLDEDKRVYVNTELSENLLLSKTSALFTYKLPDLPRLSRNEYLTGDIVKYDFDGITKLLTELTDDTIYYVSDVFGLLSSVSGTNLSIMGKSIETDKLDISRKMNSKITLTSGVVYYACRNLNISAYATLSGGAPVSGSLAVYSDITTTPTAVIGGANMTSAANSTFTGGTFTIPKGNYFKVVIGGNIATSGIFLYD